MAWIFWLQYLEQHICLRDVRFCHVGTEDVLTAKNILTYLDEHQEVIRAGEP